jgi:hypothetical protein
MSTTIKADGVAYDFAIEPTLGELRLLKRHFDLAKPGDFDPEDIDHVAGLLFLAMRRAYPSESAEQIVARVDATKKIEAVVTEEDTSPKAEGAAGS